eukprot:21297-Prymnesium_polylepis.1
MVRPCDVGRPRATTLGRRAAGMVARIRRTRSPRSANLLLAGPSSLRRRRVRAVSAESHAVAESILPGGRPGAWCGVHVMFMSYAPIIETCDRASDAACSTWLVGCGCTCVFKPARASHVKSPRTRSTAHRTRDRQGQTSVSTPHCAHTHTRLHLAQRQRGSGGADTITSQNSKKMQR